MVRCWRGSDGFAVVVSMDGGGCRVAIISVWALQGAVAVLWKTHS
jgi:hypothetical protein